MCSQARQTATLHKILKVAAEIKTKQLADKRKEWETAPEQFRTSLFPSETVQSARQESKHKRLEIAMKWKERVC